MFVMHPKEKRQIKRWLSQTTKYLKTVFPNLKSLKFDENNQPNHNVIELETTSGSVCWFNTSVGYFGWVFYENRKDYLSEMMDFLWEIKKSEGEKV